MFIAISFVLSCVTVDPLLAQSGNDNFPLSINTHLIVGSTDNVITYGVGGALGFIGGTGRAIFGLGSDHVWFDVDNEDGADSSEHASFNHLFALVTWTSPESGGRYYVGPEIGITNFFPGESRGYLGVSGEIRTTVSRTVGFRAAAKLRFGEDRRNFQLQFGIGFPNRISLP